jgi:hypothetical protein
MADYSLQDLEAGIRAADAAGDTESVQKLGAEYVKMQGTDKYSSEEYEAPKKKESLGQTIGKALTAPVRVGAQAVSGVLDIAKGLANLGAGAVRGAGEIGATLLAPIDMAARGLGIENEYIGRRDRRAAMDEGFRLMGNKPESGLFKFGKVVGEVAGTADLPGAAGKGVAEFAPGLGAAIESGGLSAGKPAAEILSREAAKKAALRVGGGAVAGGAQAGLIDPETVKGGAAIGAAIPVAGKILDASGASKVLRSGAEWLMKSALKPTATDLISGNAAKAIDTMLEKGIPATPKGIEQIHARIDELNDQIKTAIANSSERVETRKMMRPVAQKLKEFKQQAKPNADIKAIKETWDEFKNHPLLQHETPEQVIPAKVDPHTGATTPEKVIPASGKEDMSVQMAQKIKQGTYKQLAKKYGQLGSADVEAQKAIARGLKEQVAEKVPKIVPLNLEESKLFNVLDVAERRIVTEANKNPMGLAALRVDDPKAWAAFMTDRSARFKSLLARIMNRASKISSAAGDVTEGVVKAGAKIAPTQAPKEKRKQYEMGQHPKLESQ